MLDKQEEKSENQSDYGMNQTEAAAGTAAHAVEPFPKKGTKMNMKNGIKIEQRCQK